MTYIPSAIVNRLVERLYGKPIIRNDVRGELAEEIVASALEPNWTHCGGDWGSCDLINSQSGKKIQVKQSAARQSWEPSAVVRPPRFSIASKLGRWEGQTWLAEPGRNADIFVFCWHPEISDRCDHRDPDQWTFFVVAERDLPAHKTISIARLWTLCEQLSFHQLAAAVELCANQLE